MGLRHVVPLIEADNRAQVMRETWGHLAPRKNKAYQGHIVMALGCYDSGYLNPTPIECAFAGLDDSPWFYDHLNDFLQNLVAEANLEEGGVYRWEGTFRNYEFKGTVRRCTLVVDDNSTG